MQVNIKTAAQARALSDFILNSVGDGDDDGILLTQQGTDVYVSGHLVGALIDADGDTVED